jgi:hypothetical protein
MWLLLEQRILTWENLVKRGIHGPRRCILCGNCEDTVYHLFVECNFTKDIWYLMLKELKLNGFWEGGQSTDCILNWKRRKGERLEIPCFIYWEIWKHRNLSIFEDRPLNRDRVCFSIL